VWKYSSDITVSIVHVVCYYSVVNDEITFGISFRLKWFSSLYL